MILISYNQYPSVESFFKFTSVQKNQTMLIIVMNPILGPKS